jgi:hypothetical protein
MGKHLQGGGTFLRKILNHYRESVEGILARGKSPLKRSLNRHLIIASVGLDWLAAVGRIEGDSDWLLNH